jgi:nicotinamide phosphoribosyltransferase
MYSYFESRGGRYPETVFFGLQYYLLEYLAQPVTRAHVDEAARFFEAHGEPFNRAGWDYLVERYGGRFPVRIRAVPEGTIVPTGNVLFDIELTTPDARVFWIVSWLETMLVRVWYPTTVASRAHHCKRVILHALARTSDDPMGEVGFKLHDFGSRGVSSRESARLGGAAHLVSFLGSDTVEGVRAANAYYGTASGMAGYSIPAAEHSTITMWGRDGELAAYKNFVKKYLALRELPPGTPKIAACVSDSYDLFHVIENVWCGELREAIEASGGKLVARPDSGDPIEVNLKCLEIMDRKLGMRKNGKGYKVLPPYLGLIQGDGMNDKSIGELLEALVARGYSASNIAFGMGGGLLQQLDRDTQRFAFKCAAALRGDRWIDVSKAPKTDSGKRSKAGHLALVRDGGAWTTVKGPRTDDALVPIYEDGRVLRTYTLDEVRAAAAQSFA